MEVDREICCGAGNCVAVAPEVFAQDERDGLVRVRLADPPQRLADQVHRAAEMCPSGAIRPVEVPAAAGSPHRADPDGR
ncbi:hypothetical protein CIK06_10205 [Plantactinospora sp. KBS50]|nr:hypothetical protein CIK06_10205 [Plantactinospora sp. KBS50]